MSKHTERAKELRSEVPVSKGIESPAVLNEFRKCMAKKHDGMTDCADLLRANAAKGGEKKPHCDNMIEEVITLIDELTDGR